ncbi:MAG: ribosome maturation factor RimM [Nitrospira sp.]|nr:ribosome maturation factor RimM [Nitrospira sp.]
MILKREMVAVGIIQRPFGVKGEVKVRSLSDVPTRWETLSQVSLVARDGTTWDTNVTTVRPAGAEFIVGLAGLTTPEAARSWCGGLIQATRIPAVLPKDHYLECDLVGLFVHSDRGEVIGRVEEVWELPGHHVFVVRDGKRETLIPAAKTWVRHIDLENRIMIVHLLDHDQDSESKGKADVAV